MSESRRKEIARYGRRGDLVRVVEDTHRGAPVYKALYRKADGRPSATLFPRNRAGKVEAVAFASAFHERRDAAIPEPPPPPITVAELWEKFVEGHFHRFAPASQRIYRDAWTPWQALVKAETPAETLGWLSMDALRQVLEARGWAVSTIGKGFGVIRQVYRWGRMTKLIGVNDVGLYQYRPAAEKKLPSPDEFSSEEFRAILDDLRLDHGARWRAHAVLGLMGLQGARQWAVLHLKWDDVDLDGRQIIWRREWDKKRKETTQILRRPSLAILSMAWHWREVREYAGPWVFFPGNTRNKGAVYTRGALSKALHAAEKRSGIAHHRWRGPHGLRRKLAGDVLELTGNIKDALDAIGDSDIRMAQLYLKQRPERMARSFAALDEQFENETKTATEAASEGGAK